MDLSVFKTLLLGMLLAALGGVSQFLLDQDTTPSSNNPFDMSNIVKAAIVGILSGLVAQAIAKLSDVVNPPAPATRVANKSKHG